MSEPLSERVIIPMSEAQVTAVDDFRFTNRVPSRAEAIRQLLQRGLSANPHQPSASLTEVKLSSLLLAAYATEPITQFGFDEHETPDSAVKADFPPYKKRKQHHLDTFEISTLIKTAIQQIEIWEGVEGPAAAAICDLLRPLTS